MMETGKRQDGIRRKERGRIFVKKKACKKRKHKLYQVKGTTSGGITALKKEANSCHAVKDYSIQPNQQFLGEKYRGVLCYQPIIGCTYGIYVQYVHAVHILVNVYFFSSKFVFLHYFISHVCLSHVSLIVLLFFCKSVHFSVCISDYYSPCMSAFLFVPPPVCLHF